MLARPPGPGPVSPPLAPNHVPQKGPRGPSTVLQRRVTTVPRPAPASPRAPTLRRAPPCPARPAEAAAPPGSGPSSSEARPGAGRAAGGSEASTHLAAPRAWPSLYANTLCPPRARCHRGLPAAAGAGRGAGRGRSEGRGGANGAARGPS